MAIKTCPYSSVCSWQINEEETFIAWRLNAAIDFTLDFFIRGEFKMEIIAEPRASPLQKDLRGSLLNLIIFPVGKSKILYYLFWKLVLFKTLLR